MIGKSQPRGPQRRPTPQAPDDDPFFLGQIDGESSDDRIKRLEDELRALDEEDPEAGGDKDQDTKPPSS